MKLSIYKKIFSLLFFYGLLSVSNTVSATTICAYDKVPDGWVVIDSQTDYTSCGNVNGSSTKNNLWIIQQINGDLIQICGAASSIPSGWVKTGTISNFARCQAPGSSVSSTTYNNISIIERVASKTSSFSICSDQQVPSGWQSYKFATVSTTCLIPSVFDSGVTSASNNINYIQPIQYPTQPISCGVTGSAPTINSGAPFSFVITTTNISGPVFAYFSGTKNGQTDATDASVGQVTPSTILLSYINTVGSEGVYTRNFKLKNAQNQTLCTTNTVSMLLLPSPATCQLTASTSNVLFGQSVTFTINGTKLPPSAAAYWYGTKNGTSDVNGQLAGAVPSSFTYANQGGGAGSYSRFAIIRDGNNSVCTTNSVYVTFQ